MKIVLCHNYYRQRGGEDQVFEVERDLLISRGHSVQTFIRKNDEFSGLQTLKVAAGTMWNRPAAEALGELVSREKADVVHFHNWLPQISQGSFYSARRAGAAVVRTMHNYRSTCAQGVLFRDGVVCEDCVGKAVGWPAVVHACYRGNRTATLALVAALATHRALGTDSRAVDATIALTEFARSKLISAGVPEQDLFVKPNFVSPDPGPGTGLGGYMVYVGRLADTKGIDVLLDGWKLLDDPPLLKIAGTGPIAQLVEEAAARSPHIDYLGQIESSEIAHLLGDASYTILPTLNYEGFPKVIVESFAGGTPVIGSDLGSVSEIIDSGRTGYLFEPGKASSLALAVQKAMADPQPSRMRVEVRREFVERYGIDRNYVTLMEIYDRALESRRSGR